MWIVNWHMVDDMCVYSWTDNKRHRKDSGLIISPDIGVFMFLLLSK